MLTARLGLRFYGFEYKITGSCLRSLEVRWIQEQEGAPVTALSAPHKVCRRWPLSLRNARLATGRRMRVFDRCCVVATRTGGPIEGTVTGLAPNRMRKHGNQLPPASIPSLTAHCTSTITFVVIFSQNRRDRWDTLLTYGRRSLFSSGVRLCSRSLQYPLQISVSSNLLLQHVLPLLYR